MDGGVGAEGGEQGGEDGDHNLADALQGFLCGFFHRNIILRVNNELNLNLNLNLFFFYTNGRNYHYAFNI